MAATARKKPAPPATPDRILDIAERLVQTSGFNWFSYADISAELGITKASLHHHFPAKADLGRALIDRYSEAFYAALAAIDRDEDAALAKLERYASLYEAVLENHRLCLCGVLAAEYATLPAPMQDAIRKFFDANEAWLTNVIQGGRDAGALQRRGSAHDQACMVLSALEGAMLVARPYDDTARFRAATRQVLADLGAAEPAATLPAARARAKRGAARRRES